MSRIHDALKIAEQERTQVKTRSVVEDLPAEVDPPAAVALPLNGSGALVTARLAPAVSAPEPSSSNGLAPQALEQVSVMNWNPDPATVISFNGARPAVGTEEFRTLRSRLYQLSNTKTLKTVLVTSVLAGEGKTFAASNLAHTLAQHRSRRVLLIDADLRKPGLHQVLGTRAMPGLAELLCGEKDELAVLQRLTDNLFFMAGGRTASNAAELIANGQFGRLLARVSSAFDWIIIDSPPWGLVSDANVLADTCDGVLLVIQTASTPVELAQKVRQELRSKRLLGVVLNRADGAAAYGRYYYSTYGAQAPRKAKP